MYNATSLYFPSSSFSKDQKIRELYYSACTRGQLLKAWSFLTRRTYSLIPLESIDRGRIDNIHEEKGICLVQIDQIRGSEGRVHDFDRDFNPLVKNTGERWLGVASALSKGRRLPPVILVQAGNIYFVRDGHHRISVARALGETSIEAHVIIWQVKEPLPWNSLAAPVKFSPRNRLLDFPRVGQPIRAIWGSLCQIFSPNPRTPATE